ncbi:hypothetical protein ES703_109701 [subsurface metagenome]
MTHKDTYPGLLFRDIPFRRIYPVPGQLPPPVIEEMATKGSGPAGGHNRLGDIHWTQKGSAGKNSRAGGLHRINRIGFTESLRIELDSERISQVLHIRGRVQSNAQYHQIEFFFLYPILEGGVSYGYILCFRDLFSYRYVASNKSNPGKFLCSLVESLEILAKGPNIVMKYGSLRVRVMVFCQDHLLLDISAAYRGTIAVAALDNLSGTDAVNPGNFMWMLFV